MIPTPTKLLRSFALLLTVGLGVFSIVATSPQTNAYLGFKGGINRRTVCPREQVTAEWRVFEGGTNPRLVTDPPNSTVPTLDNYKVARKGELKLEALTDDTIVFLFTDEETRKAEADSIWLDLAPAEVCAQFEASPFGVYEGVLEQTAPSPLQVGRELKLTLSQGRIYGRLNYYDFRDVSLFDPDYEPTDEFVGVGLECEATTNSGLICRGHDGKAQRLTGRVTQEGFVGTFEGLGEDGLPSTEGSFSLTKLQ